MIIIIMMLVTQLRHNKEIANDEDITTNASYT